MDLNLTCHKSLNIFITFCSCSLFVINYFLSIIISLIPVCVNIVQSYWLNIYRAFYRPKLIEMLEVSSMQGTKQNVSFEGKLLRRDSLEMLQDLPLS